MTKTDTPTSVGAVRGNAVCRRLWIAAFVAMCVLSLALLHSALPTETATLTLQHALLTFLFDGVMALALVVSICGGGIWLVSLLRLGPMPRRWRILLGAALGLGLIAVLVLVLGLCGVMTRSVWIAILAISAVGGVAACGRSSRSRVPHSSRSDGWGTDVGMTNSPSPTLRPEAKDGAPPHPARTTHGRFLWLLTIPFAISALLVAAQAPGYLWQEEGYGYDTLEYHLQCPKEYFDSGRIAYLPHNVYANFPAGVEMLYLLCMIILDDSIGAAVTANYVHAMLAFLTVGAAWLAGREWSPRAGIVSGLSVGTTGWLVYLSGLAYVENGMLFFGTMSLAALLRALRSSTKHSLKWIAVSGVLCGFACGCKYIAVAMFAGPLTVACFLIAGTSFADRTRGAAVFLGAALIAFSPWLIKNTAMTGNPVFPLADSVFQASPPGWDDATRARWNASHVAAADERSIAARFRMLWRRFVLDDDERPTHGDRRAGFLVVGLGLVGLWRRRRDRVDVLLVAIIVLQALIWLFMTHLFARFAVVLLVPLSLLAGRAVLRPGGPQGVTLLVLIVIAGAAWNFKHVRRMIAREAQSRGMAAWIYKGDLPGYEYFKVVNEQLPPDAHVLLVGDAKAFYFRRRVDYCVVYNRNPFVEAIRAAQTESDVLNWLRKQGYTHILVNWLEVDRLRRTTYRYPAEIASELFERLGKGGLNRTRVFALPGSNRRYVELYEVSPKRRKPGSNGD